MRRSLGIVVVVPVPPFVRRALGIAFWRVLPSFLASKRRNVEIAPDGPHRFIATPIPKVGAKNPLAVVDEHVVSMIFVDAEVLVYAVGDRVPGNLLRKTPGYSAKPASPEVATGRIHS